MTYAPLPSGTLVWNPIICGVTMGVQPCFPVTPNSSWHGVVFVGVMILMVVAVGTGGAFVFYRDRKKRKKKEINTHETESTG